MDKEHKPVLFNEVIKGLRIKPQGFYVDGTFGRGGHSAGILSKLEATGRLLAFDKDPAAINGADRRPFNDARFCIVHSSFTEIKKETQDRGLYGKVDGILLDLGVSSPQLDEAGRGFSFIKDGPLDMRMNPQKGVSAAEWINSATEEAIANVLWIYGEERFSRRIARAVVAAREINPFATTRQLSDAIVMANPSRERRIHPATRSFQGIRIFINNELEELKEVLELSLGILAPEGRLCVVSFHSLEDRIVKRFIQQHSTHEDYPPGLPIQHVPDRRRLKKISRLIRPGEEELMSNPRARSSRLRVAEKIR